LPGKQRPLQPRQTEAILLEASKSKPISTSTVVTELQTNHDDTEHLSTNDNVPDVSQSLDLSFLMQGTTPADEWNGEEILSLSMHSPSIFPGSDLRLLLNTPGSTPQVPPAFIDPNEAVSNSVDFFMANQPLLSPQELNSPGIMQLATKICYTRQHEILGEKLVSTPLSLSYKGKI
jgi:hypothetical protein